MHAPDISNPEDYNHLNKMNLNQINAFLLSGLLKDIKSDKQLNDSSQPLNKVQIRDLIERTLENYNAKTQGKAIELNNIYEKLKVKSEGDFAVINNLKKKLTKKANFWIKGIVFGLLVQWGALYYITYNVGGWDLGEPIAYLYALGIETIGNSQMLIFRAALFNEEEESILSTRSI